MATLASLGRAALLALAVCAMAWPAAIQGAAAQRPGQPPEAAAAALAAPGSADAHVNALIDARVKDSKLVEYEVSEAIADRMFKWAQWFALLVGAPLAILAVILTLLGIRSYADFQDRMKRAREAIDRQMQKAEELQAAHEVIDRQMKDAASLQAQFVALREHLAELSNLDSSVREIAAQVDRIEQYVGFQKSAALTPALKTKLEASLARYRTWLTRIGCDTTEPVTVLISRKASERGNAHYQPPNKIVISEDLARDPDVALREYTHHVLSEAKRDDAVPFTAVQSGLSDYLPCSFNDTPLFAVRSIPAFRRLYGRHHFPNNYLRTMDNQVRLDIVPYGGSQQRIGEGWGGAFWELRALLGQPQADPLLLDAWKAAPIAEDAPGSSVPFAEALIALVDERHPQASAAARALFKRRGLELDVPARPRGGRRRSATSA